MVYREKDRFSMSPQHEKFQVVGNFILIYLFTSKMREKYINLFFRK